jgi:signal transduction histidine kinase
MPTGVSTKSPVRRGRLHPLTSDVALAVGCLLFGALTLAVDFDLDLDSGQDLLDGGAGGWEGNRVELWSYGLVFLGCCALLARRRAPVAVLLTVAALRLVLTWGSGHELPLIAATVVALYTAARRSGREYTARSSGPEYTPGDGGRGRALVVAVAVGVVLAAGVAAIEREPFLPEFLGELTINLLPIAVADATRSRADRLQALIDGEAEKRVQAERLRIARDLHDVVAHGLSTIAVQSGVAAHLLDRDPSQAREALEAINTTGRQSLDELRSMVGVLRSTETAPLIPAPTDPNDLAAIVDGATAAGLTVSTKIDGSFPADAGESCIVATHRIVQEALANVARHAGPVPTDLRLAHYDDRVELSVRNHAGHRDPGRPGPGAGSQNGSGSGVGIVGMTERAESLGGSLQAGPTTDGGFEVAAVLPYRASLPSKSCE